MVRPLKQWIQPLGDLIGFATVRPVRRDAIYLRPDLEGQRETWVELLEQWVDLDMPPPTDRALISQDMLFMAEELPGGFGAGLRRWLSLREKVD